MRRARGNLLYSVAWAAAGLAGLLLVLKHGPLSRERGLPAQATAASPVPAAAPAGPPSCPPAPPARPEWITLSILSDPPGASVKWSGGTATTPAALPLPRSTATLPLVLGKAGYEDVVLDVVPDAPRSHFARLYPTRETHRAEVDRYIDGVLDERLQGCCRRHACSHLLLELLVAPSGEVEEAHAFPTPRVSPIQTCLDQVVQRARQRRFSPFSGTASSRFVRSYDFDSR